MRIPLPAPAPLFMAFLLTCVACGDPDRAPREAAAADAAATVAPDAVPDGAEAVSLLGRPLYAPLLPDSLREDREARLAEAREALEASPEDADALIWMGRRLAYLGRYREAIDVYGRGIALHPGDARFYRHRGHRYITVRRLDDAVTDLRRAADLVEGTEDEVEPDGPPNAANLPTSTLHFNVWYHLGLAHYLKGELEQALLAFNECLDVSRHADSVIAATYWLNNILRRLGMQERAREARARVRGEQDVIESGSYLDVLLLHDGERTADDLVGAGSAEPTLASTTTAYGVGSWHFVEGRRERAYEIWEGMLAAEDQWAAFGYLAAEAELARVQGR